MNLSYEEIMEDQKICNEMDKLIPVIIAIGTRKITQSNGYSFNETYEMWQIPANKNFPILIKNSSFIGGSVTYRDIEKAKSAVRNYCGTGIKWKRI